LTILLLIQGYDKCPSIKLILINLYFYLFSCILIFNGINDLLNDDVVDVEAQSDNLLSNFRQNKQ